MTSILPMAAYLMQAAQGSGLEGLIPPAPPGYPPNTQPLPMDMPRQQNVVETPVEEAIEVEARDPIQHKGLFGVKGTLRDVLGLLGDSYLMVNGRNPYYAGIRRQELASDQLAGRYQNNEEENFINNPLLAIQRLAESGYGEQAQSLYQDYTKNKAAEAQAALGQAQLARQNARDDQLAKQGDTTAQKNFIEGVLSKLYAGVSDEASLALANKWAESKLAGLGLEGYRLPKNLKEAGRFGIQPYQQQRLEDFDEGLNIQQQRANTDAATARPRADTPLEEYRRLSGIPEERRTPEQKAFMQKYTSTGRGSRRRTGGGGSEGLPPRPGTYKGQTATSPSGDKFSWDGKSWKRQ